MDLPLSFKRFEGSDRTSLIDSLIKRHRHQSDSYSSDESMDLPLSFKRFEGSDRTSLIDSLIKRHRHQSDSYSSDESMDLPLSFKRFEGSDRTSLIDSLIKRHRHQSDSYSSDESMDLSLSFKQVLKEHEYTIIKEIGHRISGRAFLVKNPNEDFLVVKEINYRDNVNFNLNAAKNEIKILKNLHHGYIVGYEDSFEDQESGLFYIVSEYCAEGDLYKKMQTQKIKGFFEEEEILDWLVQICLALQYLHENNVLHRDIKPQNVFLKEDGYINLGDFGCSKVLQSADEYATPCVGAELYASPEIFQRRHDSKSDIWSLGWLLHDLCMLDVWSNISKRRRVHASSLRGTKPEISRYSDNLQTLIKEMLSCDPHDRPSAEEILAKPFLNIAVIKNKGIPDALQKSFIKSIRKFDEAYNKHYKNFKSSVKEWETTTDSLESIHYKATAGSLSGAVIGAAGGITALVGAILAPFTFGASLIVAGVGIGVGVAGGLTGAASNITNSVKQKSLRESFEKIQQDYKTASEPIINSLKMLRKLLRKITKFRDFVPNTNLNHAQTAWRIGRTTAACITEVVTLGMLASFGRIAVQAAGVGRAVAAASGVLSSVLVIADVAFIVKDSREIHQMRKQWKTNDPEKVTSPVLKAIAQMRKSHEELCSVLKVIEETREELKKELAKHGRDLESLNI